MFGGLGGKKEEKKEEDDQNEEEKPEDAAEGGGDDDGGGGDDEGDEEVLQVAKTRKINKEQFKKEVSERTTPPSRGDTEQERDHWSRPRRWQVRLWQVRVENMTDEAILVFGNFIFGGTKEEFLVRAGGKEPSIWVAGDEGVILRTPVVHDVPGDGEDTECDFDVSFEWHGSYLDLERQNLRLEIWNWARWRINKFDCFCEEPLLSFAKGPIQNEMECNKVDKFGKKQSRVKVAFKLFFQEIYDFELSMPVWRASAVPTCKRLLERLRDNIEEEDEELTGGGARGTLGRSTRQTGAKQTQALPRTLSLASDESIHQTIHVQTPALRAHGTRSCYLVSNKSGNNGGGVLWDSWTRKKFRGYFRGTCSDLGNASLEVNLMSFEKPRELQELVTQLGGGRPGGSRYHVILANAEIPLRGVLEHGEVKATLRPAPWFYGLEEGGKVHRQRCGLLQGHVAVDHRPRYQQTDDVSDELDLRKRYLFVKVIKVDRVVTPDTRPTDEIDTFVEVTFDGVAKRTRICQDDVSPSFNDDLVFELSLAKTSSKNERQDDNEATWEELERKGPVFIDLWTIGSKSNEHLGSVEAFLQDILVDEVGQPQKEVTRTARDARLKRQENFSVRAFRGQRRLKFTWGLGQESNIFYEMWFLPDLDPMAVLKALPAEVPLPKALAEKFEEKQMIWDEVADELNGIHENMEQIEQDELRRTGRQFQCTAASIWPVQSAQEHFLPRFCDVLRPPHGVDCATAINHYVGCFPYMESKSEDTVSTPNFFCALRKGKILEHALLHCSLLLGLSFKAYVCCGTNLKGDAHSWVAVFEEDGTVRFWEPFLGTGTLQLRRRFAHPQYLLPGPSNKPARSMKDADLQAEERRRRRLLRQMKGRRLGRLVLKGDPAAAAPPTPTKKSMFRATAAPVVENGTHEHDVVYVDVLDLGLKERPEEDRSESSALHCAMCFAVAGGSYFYRGFSCPTCEKAGQRYLLCYKCAEPLFDDDEELEAVEYNPRDRFDFEAYNSYLGDSDSNSVLPYRSVEVVFNNANIWMNRQDSDPRYIFWDLQNKDYWHPFVSKVSGLRPCFSSCRFPMAGRDEGWCLRQRRELLQELRKVIQMHRAHKNLGTRWVTSPQLLRFLEAGLKIRSQLDMEGHILEEEESPREEMGHKNELLEQLDEWEKTLNAKTPREYKLSSMPMHFNYLDADEIAEKVMELCPFLMTRDKSAQFAVACHLVPLPGEVVSIYLYCCELHALSQLQLREEKERQQAPKDDRGLTVAQLVRNFGKGFQKEEAATAPGQSLATMIIEAAKKAKNLDAAVVEAVDPPKVKKNAPPAGEARGDSGAGRAKMAESMTGFEANYHSRFVRIEKEALEASYVATKEEDDYALHGGLLGNGPLPAVAAGKYFELEVLRTREGHPDGLCVGVTQTRPQDLTTPPDTMDAIPQTWIAGYDGLFWDPTEADMFPAPWNPSTLQNGDQVGVLIRPDGAFVVLVNGEVVLEREHAQVPYASDLFVVVDLLGSCDAVKLRLDARPSLAEPMNAAENVPQEEKEVKMSGFCLKKKGHYVRLSEDALSATYTGQTGHEMHGGLIGNEPLARNATSGVYFSVELTKTRSEMMDGLTLGVTTNGPKDLDEMTDTIDRVQACWTVGYDGQMYNGKDDRWVDLSWNGRDLHVGDVVTLQVTEAGQMKIFVNHRFVADGHSRIPCAKPLYALVDLIGTADGVRLLLDAPPPPACSVPSSAAQTATAPETATEEVDLKPFMEGWCRMRHGRLVEVSEDGLTGRYLTGSSYELHGGLMGDGPLRSFEMGWWFSVRVEELRPGSFQDGLALGVTTCPPSRLKELPLTMDEVDPCWLLGFDGVEWDGAQLTWGPASWSPATLKVGDVVGVLVTLQGELQIALNGQRVTEATFALPTERPLYAVVDLIGATRAVAFLPEERPDFDLVGPKLVFVPPLLREDPFLAPSEAGEVPAPEEVEFPEVPEVQVIITKAPSTVVAPEEAPKSPREDAVEAVRVAQALATERPLASSSASAPAGAVGPSTPSTRGPKRKPVKGGKAGAARGAGTSGTATALAARNGAPAAATSRTASRPSAAAPVRGFHRTKHGMFVTVSADGLVAKHEAPFEDDMFGGVLGVEPLQQEPRGFYFEVKVQEAATGHPDGLAVGVTTENPATLKEVPEILDGLKQAWLVGFDGIMYDGHDFTEIDWYPAELRIGDRVGVLITPKGQMQVFVNGKFRLDGPGNVETSRPLFLAVDLIGNTEAVALLPEARCPAGDGAAARHASHLKPKGGFHRPSLGRQLRLLGEWTVEHLGHEDLQGTALGALALDSTAEGLRYFEVHIDEVIEGKADGLAIGVTSHRPEEILEPPSSSDALRPAWLVGFDGAAWDGQRMEWFLSTWDTRQLRAGDAVGALVDAQGVLRIFVNGTQVARGPTIPLQVQALYPVVDLLGAVKRLSLLPVATAPTVPEEPPTPVVSYMTCFHREKVGAKILLSEDGSSAQRATYASSAWEGGLVFGDGPLPAREADGAVGFSLRVTAAAQLGDSEGLALGFTTRPPNELETLPSTADEVDPSYLLGFDGAAWDGSALKWHFSHWQPQTLKAFDRVDVLLEKHRLQVAVNGSRVAAQHMQVSSLQGPFYALLDIASAGMGVALLASTAPQIGEIRPSGAKKRMRWAAFGGW